MEEIDLKDVINYFLTKKLFIILITLITLLFGVVYTVIIQEPRYKSSTKIVLTKESEEDNINSAVTLNQKLVDTYSVIMKSNAVIKRVINNLNLSYTAEKLKKNISIESVNNTEVIQITVVDKDNKLAMDIANEIAEVANSVIVSKLDIKNISILDYAELAYEPYNIQVTKQLVLSILAGIILSFTILFIVYYFDTTIKSVEEVEKQLGIPVIGKISKLGGGKHE